MSTQSGPTLGLLQSHFHRGGSEPREGMSLVQGHTAEWGLHLGLCPSSPSVPAPLSAAAQRPQEGSLLRPGGLARLLEGQFLSSVRPGLVLEPQTLLLLLEDEERGYKRPCQLLPALPLSSLLTWTTH